MNPLFARDLFCGVYIRIYVYSRGPAPRVVVAVQNPFGKLAANETNTHTWHKSIAGVREREREPLI